MPAAQDKGMKIVVGGPYSSGILVGGSHYDYGEATSEAEEKIDRVRKICARYRVSIKAAALQFSAAHPAVYAVIPGTTRPERIGEDLSAIKEKIPEDFWKEMRSEGLVSSKAPLPL